MGCDIHAYLEECSFSDTEGNECWCTYSSLHLYRDYLLFALLAGVRDGWGFTESNFSYEPKGLPKNVSPTVEKESEYWASDGHSHSWLTRKELEVLLTRIPKEEAENYNAGGEIKTVIATMKSMEENGRKARFVFWFDN